MKQSGLNEQERNFIKKDLNKRYENYRYLQRQPMEITVPNYQQTLRLIQSIFREITDNPRTMLSMSDFLYQHLEEYTKIVHNIRDLQDNPLQTEQDQHLISLGFDRLIEMEKDFQQDFIQVTQDERDSLQNL